VSDICLVPRPVSCAPGTGHWRLTAEAVIVAPSAETPAARLLAERLRAATGFAVPVEATSPAGAPSIDLRLDPSAAGDLGDEGYRLAVATEGAVLTAVTDAGLLWGVQTLRQLLPPAIEADTAQAGVEWTIPAVRIEDRPRFAWRGGHLDVCRHFFDVDFVKRFIDLLALHRMNVFHWHLTEDQGWRLQIDAFPRLTGVGAWRTRDGERYGGFYTKDEARDVVAYAAARGITVVPEIELPGHALAALAAHPEYACAEGPFEVTGEWGVFDDVYCAGNDDTLRFLEQVFDEVLEIFPSEFVHVGGDECPKTRWKECPRCQARIRAEGLAGEEALQSWVIRHFDRYLADRGRRLVGWDEILEGGLAPGATVMSWRGVEGGLEAARAGHDVVMTPQSHVYLDRKHYEGDDEPGRLSVATLETCYGFDPTIPELTAEQAEHVLGVQANIWSEGFDTPAGAQQMIWPRLAAVAEMAWTPQANRDFADFTGRFRRHAARLDALDVRYYRDRAIWP
jgi:hexosaminidase